MLHKYIALASVSFSAVAGLAVRNSAASSLPNSGMYVPPSSSMLG